MTCQHREWQPLTGVILIFVVSSLVSLPAGVAIAQTGTQDAETAFSKKAPQRELLLMMEIPIVITAAKREQPMIESPSTISVITAEQIRKSGATNLTDIFRMIPGIDILTLSVSDPNVSARGLNGPRSDKMLALIDGRSIYSDFLGITVWTPWNLCAEEIEQIEIIRGPGSALYGANAFAGVINIITKSPLPPFGKEGKGGIWEGTGIKIAGGELGAQMASITHANRLGNFGYKLSFGWDRANQWRDENQIGQRNIDRRLQFEYEFNPTAKATIYAGHGYSLGETMTGLNLFKRDGTMSYIQYKYVQEELKLQTFWTRTDSAVQQPSLSANHILSDTYDLEINDSIRFGSRNILTLGGSYRLNTINSDLIDEFHRQHLWAVYLQDEFKPVDNLAVTIGVRYDHHPLTKNPLTPRASIMYSPTTSHLFRVSVGKAFRNPTFIESYLLTSSKRTLGELNPQLPEIPFTVEALGNPALNPEEIKTYEVSYQNMLKNRIISNLNFFFNQLDELIEFGAIETFPKDSLFPGSPGGIIPSKMSYYNHDQAAALGGEAEVTFYTTKWLRGFANYSYQRLTNTLTNERIESAPAHKLNGGLRLKFGNGITANIAAHYVSQTRWDGALTDAYTLVNAKLTYCMMAERAEITISAFNLSNNKHREHPWGDELGRRTTAGLTYRF